MVQVLTYDPSKGPAIPMPNWFKVVHQDNTSVTIEGNIPDQKDSRYRNIRVQLVLKLDTDGTFTRMCTRRVKGEFRRWGHDDIWDPYGHGGSVLTHRMMSNLASAHKGYW